MAKRNIIQLKEVGTIVLLFENGLKLIFSNIAYALKCDSIFISQSQPPKTGISYYDHLEYIVLK